MLSVSLTILSGLILFIVGCYLGHQVGCTRHIREQLAKVRSDDRN